MTNQELIKSLEADIALLEFELDVQRTRLRGLYDASED